MTNQDTIQSRSIIVFLFVLPCLQSCDADWAKRLDTGRVQPNFRLTVTRQEPSDKEVLFERFKALAHSEGFTRYEGRPISDKTFSPDTNIGGFDWFPSESSEIHYRIATVWTPYDATMPQEFILIYFNNSMEDFTAEQWLIFGEWRDAVLPTAFPDASIEVLNHPAKFTRRDDLKSISDQTGIAIPEKYRAFATN